MANQVSISGKVSWTIFEDIKSKRWIAVCRPLNLSVEERTLGELSETIEDAIHALLLDLAQCNELEKFLREHGWRLEKPLPTRLANVRFSMPYSTERKLGHDLASMPA